MRRDILSPCKCKYPLCDLLAYNIVSKFIRNPKHRRSFYVYKLALFFDCIFHGSQQSYMTTSFDPDFGEKGDWRVWAPMHARSQGRNKHMQKSKMNRKRDKGT